MDTSPEDKRGRRCEKSHLNARTLLYDEDTDAKQAKTAGKCSLISLRNFVLVSGALMCAQSALSIYTKSVLTSIERRFQISSSLAGLIVGSFNFGNMMFVVLVSKLSSSGHRPRIMAAGSIVIAVGGFFNVIPHFAGSNYEPSTMSHQGGIDHVNQTNFTYSAQVMEPLMDCASSSLYVLLIIGGMLQGIGATVLVPLGSSYVDDFAKPGNSPLYLGIMFLLQNLGPGVGYLVGSLTNMMYVDFDRVGKGEIRLKMIDESWVGAWWFGYVIIGVSVILTAVPLFWFPRTLRKEPTVGMKTIRETKRGISDDLGADDDVIPLNHAIKETRAKKASQRHRSARNTRMMKIKGIFKDLYLTVKRLLTDPVYMLVVMGYSGLMFIVGALTAFMPKFLEVVFYQSKSQASLIFGLSMPLVICIGLFSGGFIVQRSKWKIKGTMHFMFAMAGLTMFVFIPSYYVTCNPTDGLSCLNGTSSFSNGTECTDARGQYCKSQCYIFVVLMSLAALICCNIVTPSYSVILRTVNPKDKCTAIGLKFLIIRLVAFIPSPMITGAVIDGTCLQWSKTPECVGTSTCLRYDREFFRYSYLHIIAFALVFTCLFEFAGCLVVHRRKPVKGTSLGDNRKDSIL